MKPFIFHFRLWRALAMALFFISFSLPAHVRGAGWGTVDWSDIVGMVEFPFELSMFSGVFINGVVVIHVLWSLRRGFRRKMNPVLFCFLILAAIMAWWSMLLLVMVPKILIGPFVWALSITFLTVIEGFDLLGGRKKRDEFPPFTIDP
jgi:hypothetical protein